MCEGCTVHTEVRARKVRKSRAEAFVFTELFSSCVSAVAAVLPRTCVTHPRKHGHFSTTTIRMETDCHPTPYSLSCLQIYGKGYSPVFGEECYAVNTSALGYEGFPPSFPRMQNTYWNLEKFFFQGNNIVTKMFPRTRMAAVWRLLFWWGFFSFESVGFLRSLSIS